MQIDWTTFALEILNFLVLVWILKHYFYQPVLSVLDKRRAAVQAESDKAAQLKRDAEALKSQYEARMNDWKQEQQKLRQSLDHELAKERERRMAALKKSLDEEAEALSARAKAEGTAREAALLRQASADAFGAAAAMLKRMASKELTAMIAQVFMDDLAALPPEKEEELRRMEAETADVASAHPLDVAARKSLIAALSQATGRPLKANFRESPELIAGLRVSLGSYTLSADLAGELAFFRQENHG